EILRHGKTGRNRQLASSAGRPYNLPAAAPALTPEVDPFFGQTLRRQGEGMKIQLLSPAGEIHRNRSGIFKTSLRYAPLTLTTLAALVPAELDAEVSIQDEGVQPLDLDFDADLVGITAITGTSLRAYRIADEFRAKGHTVVLGGVHPTLLPDEAAPHADALVLGYAEKTWPQLLRDFAVGELKPRYSRPTGRSLAGVPIARRDLLKKE